MECCWLVRSRSENVNEEGGYTMAQDKGIRKAAPKKDSTKAGPKPKK